MEREMTSEPETRDSFVTRIARQPRIVLLLLTGWSVLAAVTQLFVNSGLFIDIRDIEIDGALGGFAFTLNSIPLAVLYLYCARNPDQFRHVFWLAFIHQTVVVIAVLYHWVLGTFSVESIIAPVAGSGLLALLSFLQIFEPRPESAREASPPL
jgi:hypothetical protein